MHGLRRCAPRQTACFSQTEPDSFHLCQILCTYDSSTTRCRQRYHVVIASVLDRLAGLAVARWHDSPRCGRGHLHRSLRSIEERERLRRVLGKEELATLRIFSVALPTPTTCDEKQIDRCTRHVYIPRGGVTAVDAESPPRIIGCRLAPDGSFFFMMLFSTKQMFGHSSKSFERRANSAQPCPSGAVWTDTIPNLSVRKARSDLRRGRRRPGWLLNRSQLAMSF